MKKLFISIVVALVLTATMVPVISASAQETQLLDHVVISPASATVAPLGTQQFTATGENSSNQTVSGVTYSWTVVSGGGTISNTGLFTAGEVAGSYTNTILVTAVKGNVTKTANATVTVAIPGLLDHVVISPASTTVAPLGMQQFTATGKDAFNQSVSDVLFDWSVVAGGGDILDNGLFTAGNVTGNYINTVLVTAIKGDITRTANATVTVAIPGLLDHVVISPASATIASMGTQLFTAVGQDAFNQAVSDVIISWSVVNGGGSIINTGLFTAGDVVGVYNNTVKVTAVKGDITKTSYATVTVTSGKNEFQTPHGWSMGKKTGWGGGNTPPGWSKGNKTGWNGESTPPNFVK
ncbi:hypothetical protein ES703_69635 [subsurface metagenome]